jgi:hypothetical protein
MNASSPLYARGHCDGARLADLVEGDDDDARCGPWSRRRRGCAGGYYQRPAAVTIFESFWPGKRRKIVYRRTW